MKHLFIILGLGSAAALHGVALAAPVIYQCPKSIAAEAVSVTAPDSNWKPFVSSPLYLHGAAPADGPPERLGILRGEDPRKTKVGLTQTFSLAGTYPEGKWLRCDYGTLGEVSLSRRLADAVTQCTVTTMKGSNAGENEVMIQCR